MSQRPVIYVSAVSKELERERQLVADILKSFGCEPVYNPNTEPHDLLRALKIVNCNGVMQLVGKCFGNIPLKPDPRFGRVGFTQYEALFARDFGHKVWYLLLDDDFPTEASEPEPQELRELQAAYRQRVQSEEFCFRVKSLEELKSTVLKLRDEIIAPGDKSAPTAKFSDPASFCMEFEPRAREAYSDAPPVAKMPIEPTVGATPKPDPLPPAQSVQPIFDEDVQFSVYRPRTMSAAKWHAWLTFAYRGTGGPDEPNPAEEVERQARAILGGKYEEYAQARQESSAALPRESTITLAPEVAGLEFNPPHRNFTWQEPVHREEFRVRASPDYVGKTVRGKITVYLGMLAVAEINVSVKIVAADEDGAEPKSQMETDRARVYRKIFASYSRRDRALVDHFEKLQAALGDRYLRDVHDIRAGERWSQSLEKMIREADVFQLFWSSNSMRSRYVRQEWEYALGLERPNFVRPTYWENPLPADPGQNLPPKSLSDLHFQLIPTAPHDEPILEAPPASTPPTEFLIRPKSGSSLPPSNPTQNSEGAKAEKTKPGGKFCTNCGASISSGAKFCPECGARVASAEREEETAFYGRHIGVAAEPVRTYHPPPPLETSSPAPRSASSGAQSVGASSPSSAASGPPPMAGSGPPSRVMKRLVKGVIIGAPVFIVLALGVWTLQRGGKQSAEMPVSSPPGQYAESSAPSAPPTEAVGSAPAPPGNLKIAEAPGEPADSNAATAEAPGLAEANKAAEEKAAAEKAAADMAANEVGASRSQVGETVANSDDASFVDQYSDTLKQYRAALQLTDRASDPLKWAGTQWNIAYVLAEQGRYAEAENTYRSALEEYQRVRGEEDKDVLTLRNNVALTLRDQGKYAEAETEFRSVLALEEKALGPDQPNTLLTCYNLALCLKFEGKANEARVFAQHAAAGSRAVLGANHPSTLKYEKLWEELQTGNSAAR